MTDRFTFSWPDNMSPPPLRWIREEKDDTCTYSTICRRVFKVIYYGKCLLKDYTCEICWLNFDFFYELSSMNFLHRHYLSIQPVYVNRWLHNHLKNVCIVPSRIENYPNFCHSICMKSISIVEIRSRSGRDQEIIIWRSGFLDLKKSGDQEIRFS